MQMVKEGSVTTLSPDQFYFLANLTISRTKITGFPGKGLASFMIFEMSEVFLELLSNLK